MTWHLLPREQLVIKSGTSHSRALSTLTSEAKFSKTEAGSLSRFLLSVCVKKIVRVECLSTPRRENIPTKFGPEEQVRPSWDPRDKLLNLAQSWLSRMLPLERSWRNFAWNWVGYESVCVCTTCNYWCVRGMQLVQITGRMWLIHPNLVCNINNNGVKSSERPWLKNNNIFWLSVNIRPEWCTVIRERWLSKYNTR